MLKIFENIDNNVIVYLFINKELFVCYFDCILLIELLNKYVYLMKWFVKKRSIVIDMVMRVE